MAPSNKRPKHLPEDPIDSDSDDDYEFEIVRPSKRQRVLWTPEDFDCQGFDCGRSGCKTCEALQSDSLEDDDEFENEEKARVMAEELGAEWRRLKRLFDPKTFDGRLRCMLPSCVLCNVFNYLEKRLDAEDEDDPLEHHRRMMNLQATHPLYSAHRSSGQLLNYEWTIYRYLDPQMRTNMFEHFATDINCEVSTRMAAEIFKDDIQQLIKSWEDQMNQISGPFHTVSSIYRSDLAALSRDLAEMGSPSANRWTFFDLKSFRKAVDGPGFQIWDDNTHKLVLRATQDVYWYIDDRIRSRGWYSRRSGELNPLNVTKHQPSENDFSNNPPHPSYYPVGYPYCPSRCMVVDGRVIPF